MTQYSLPASDLIITNWTQGAGDGDAVAWDELDEGFGAGRGSGSGPDDATTYWTTTTDLAQLRMQMTNLTNPGVTTGHTARMRSRKSAAAGQQQDHYLYLVDSLGGVIAFASFASVDEVWTTRAFTLTAGEVGGVTYTDIRVEMQLDEVGGGSGRSAHVSAFEFECPDAAAAQDNPELRGRPYGLRGDAQMRQLLAR